MLTTVPTLVNDVVSSNPAICCRMMSLISVGRTAMVSTPLAVYVYLRPIRRLVVWTSGRLIMLPPSGDKPGAHLFQFIAHAAVDNLIADPDDDAADDVRIDLESQLDLLARHRFQLLADMIQFGVAEPFRRRHLSDRDAPLRPQLIVEYLPDLRDEHRPVALDQHPGQVSRFSLHVDVERGFQRFDSALRGDTGVRQISRDPVVGDDAREHGQVLTPGVERPLVFAETEDRLCVSFCRAAGHGCPFSASRESGVGKSESNLPTYRPTGCRGYGRFGQGFFDEARLRGGVKLFSDDPPCGHHCQVSQFLAKLEASLFRLLPQSCLRACEVLFGLLAGFLLRPADGRF